MHINKEKFADLENAFIRLKANHSDVAALRVISDSLHALTNKNIKVDTISPTSKNQECRVMSIYPEESTIDKLIQAIVTEQKDAVIASIWNDTTQWIIEIDERILTNDVQLDEKELTALILHEVGHVIYSNSIPMRLAKVVRLQYASSNMVTKQLLKDTFFSKVLCFPILNACNTNTNKSSLKAELQADTYSVKSGYGKYLSSAMDKIIVYAGSSTTPEKDMEDLMGFSIDTILSLQKRQNMLVRKNMNHMIASTPSRFATAVVNKFSNGLRGNTNGGSVVEAVMDNYLDNKIQKITDTFYASEAFFSRVHRMKKIDPADIDYIGLEINNIKSNDDKMMIVSYIYSKLDAIDYYLSIIDSKNPRYVIPHSRESLVSMRNALEKYKNDAITRKLPEINYGITIQYPIGYEG